MHPKKILLSIFKLVIIYLIIDYLLKGNSLNLEKLNIIITKPILTLLIFALRAMIVLLNSKREEICYKQLLKSADAPSTKSIFEYTWSSIFLGIVLPGMVGSDSVKSYFISKYHQKISIKKTLSVTFLNRLAGLFALSSCAILGYWISLFFGNDIFPELHFIFVFSSFLMFMSCLFAPKIYRFTLSKLKLGLNPPSSSDFLFFSFLCIASQALTIFSVILITLELYPALEVSKLLFIIPAGLISLIIPIGPYGLGVGHLAYNILFERIGIQNGGDIFNIFFFHILIFCVLGSIVWIKQGFKAKEAIEASKKI